MAHKYLVDLTDEEQGYLLDVIRKGKTTARRVARAHVLLRAAEGLPMRRSPKRSIWGCRPCIAPASALWMKD
jgi:hypothetical protein